ncbi:hypothetical protein NMG60_11006495 [Bertholletia excelsa]
MFSSTASAVLLLLLTAATIPATTPSTPILGLDSFLNQQSRLDPQASNDSFISLSSSLKKSLSLYQQSPFLSSLLSLQISVPVTVKLVGSSFTSSAISLLNSFLSAAISSDQFHVITPFSHQNQHLALSHSLHLDVSLSSSSLSSLLDEAIRSELSKTPSSLRSPFLSPYAYNYGFGESSPAFTKCLGSIWTGKDRYLWIDLAAGPVDYGPALAGDGVLPRGEFHPLTALRGRPKSQKALLAALASLVWSAYQVLVVPSLRIPVPFENSLITYEVRYSDCSICSFAISRATTSYTSRYLFDNYTLIVSEYLDSKRLHQILSESADELRRIAGFPEEDFGRVLPVFVFDLDLNIILLLDRYHQSVEFKDMVIAVRTKNAQTVSDYSCNGRHVFTQTRELERPLVGSILQRMWGVSPTHLLWSPRQNNTLVDYTWNFSTLSFVQKDAARGNVLLTSLNYSISSAIDVFESILAHGGDRKLLKRGQHNEFVQRWSLFKYKLDKAVFASSHMDFELALYFLRSSDHDLYAIHSLVYHASQELEASLVCFKDPPFPWASASTFAMVFLALFYVYLKKDKLFRNKRKQF